MLLGASSYYLNHNNVLCYKVKKDVLKVPDDDDDSKTPWIEKHLKKQVLGQIGSQLLLECWHSVFVPKSLGIVCIGTEVR